MACPDFLLTKKPARNGFAEVARIIHHVLLEHLLSSCYQECWGEAWWDYATPY